MNHPEKTELKNCFNLFETMHFDISKMKQEPRFHVDFSHWSCHKNQQVLMTHFEGEYITLSN